MFPSQAGFVGRGQPAWGHQHAGVLPSLFHRASGFGRLRRETGLSGGQEAGVPLNYCKEKKEIPNTNWSWARAAARGLCRGRLPEPSAPEWIESWSSRATVAPRVSFLYANCRRGGGHAPERRGRRRPTVVMDSGGGGNAGLEGGAAGSGEATGKIPRAGGCSPDSRALAVGPAFGVGTSQAVIPRQLGQWLWKSSRSSVA